MYITRLYSLSSPNGDIQSRFLLCNGKLVSKFDDILKSVKWESSNYVRHGFRYKYRWRLSNKWRKIKIYSTFVHSLLVLCNWNRNWSNKLKITHFRFKIVDRKWVIWGLFLLISSNQIAEFHFLELKTLFSWKTLFHEVQAGKKFVFCENQSTNQKTAYFMRKLSKREKNHAKKTVKNPVYWFYAKRIDQSERFIA